MASAVFEGTSLVNMFVRGCWVNGIRRLIINRRGDEEEFFEIRTEWSDRNVLYLHRSYSDLGRLFQRLRDSFPEDRPELSRSPLLQEIMRSNGFCLANTETIVIDHSIPNGKDNHLDVDSTEHLFENGSEFTSELEDSEDPAAYVTNLSYYHLVPFETDILD
uniref:PX domain containing 1 n=1 Tax=Sarcophilus harrisii TaxID=9305 RepID=G3W7S6_SARHA